MTNLSKMDNRPMILIDFPAKSRETMYSFQVQPSAYHSSSLLQTRNRQTFISCGYHSAASGLILAQSLVDHVAFTPRSRDLLTLFTRRHSSERLATPDFRKTQEGRSKTHPEESSVKLSRGEEFEEYAKRYQEIMQGGHQCQGEVMETSDDLNVHSYPSIISGYNRNAKDVSMNASVDGSGQAELTHTDSSGRAVMVDVGGKNVTVREATAQAVIYLGPEVTRLVAVNKMKKGDVLTVSQLAGIMSAKMTSQLIPLCHNIGLTKVDVTCILDETAHSVVITSLARTVGRTGVEMEALIAASVAALTVYDMCKAVTHDMVIRDIRLISKSGGKRDFTRN